MMPMTSQSSQENPTWVAQVIFYHPKHKPTEQQQQATMT